MVYYSNIIMLLIALDSFGKSTSIRCTCGVKSHPPGRFANMNMKVCSTRQYVNEYCSRTVMTDVQVEQPDGRILTADWLEVQGCDMIFKLCKGRMRPEAKHSCYKVVQHAWSTSRDLFTHWWAGSIRHDCCKGHDYCIITYNNTNRCYNGWPP